MIIMSQLKNWHLRNASQLRSLTSLMIVTPAENICNQFEPRSGPNPHSNFDTQMLFLQATKSMQSYPSTQKVRLERFRYFYN